MKLTHFVASFLLGISYYHVNLLSYNNLYLTFPQFSLEWHSAAELDSIKEVYYRAMTNFVQSLPEPVPVEEFCNKYLAILYKQIHKAPNKFYLCIAKNDQDTIIGFALYSTYRIQDPEQLYLELICVDPPLQGKGIGTTLILNIKKYLECFKKLNLACHKSNIQAYNFYMKLGFQQAPHPYHAPERYEEKYISLGLDL